MVSLENISEFVSTTVRSPETCEHSRRGIMCILPHIEFQHDGYMLDCYPQINLKNDILNAPSHKNANVDMSSRNLLIPVNETVPKRIIRTFFENGFRAALSEACSEQTATKYNWLAKASIAISKLINQYEKLKYKIFPYAHKYTLADIANFAETRDWLNSFIRYIAWHPNWFKLAVAGSDDIVRIYTDTPNIISLLKCAGQKHINCMAWRPLCGGELAIGCERGMYVWSSFCNIQLLGSSQYQLIKHPNDLPVTALQWNINGTLIATGSIGDPNIIIWDMNNLESVALKRIGPPITHIKWSPNNSWLFTATTESVFRVWDCENYWKPERWVLNSGTIQCACWSPCSNFLVFVDTNDSILYRLAFTENNLFVYGSENKDVLPIADLSQCTVGHRAIGGVPQQIVWDPNGCYLIITFKNSSCIAVFRTLIHGFDLQLSPAFFLTGQSSVEYPNFVCFQSVHRKNSKSILTIGWSSGRVQFYPF